MSSIKVTHGYISWAEHQGGRFEKFKINRILIYIFMLTFNIIALVICVKKKLFWICYKDFNLRQILSTFHEAKTLVTWLSDYSSHCPLTLCIPYSQVMSYTLKTYAVKDYTHKGLHTPRITGIHIIFMEEKTL